MTTQHKQNKPRGPQPIPTEQDVLRRMLSTPPNPHVAKPKSRKKPAKKPAK
jgi:hypothetical protein